MIDGGHVFVNWRTYEKDKVASTLRKYRGTYEVLKKKLRKRDTQMTLVKRSF